MTNDIPAGDILMGSRWVECNPQGLHLTVAPPKKACQKNVKEDDTIRKIILSMHIS